MEEKSVYVIIAIKESLKYKILSFKDSEISNSPKIKVGKYYDLQLNRIYPYEKMMPNLSIRTVQFGKYKFKIEEKYHYSLYGATNLKGIYLISTLIPSDLHFEGY